MLRCDYTLIEVLALQQGGDVLPGFLSNLPVQKCWLGQNSENRKSNTFDARFQAKARWQVRSFEIEARWFSVVTLFRGFLGEFFCDDR